MALQHIHIIGVCGTFMGGVARLATEMGYRVSGSDKAFYPPMSEQLAEIGLEIFEGFAASNLDSRPDLVIVGNAVSRGNPEVEALLDAGLPYTSGAQWLGDVVLRGRHVLAVAGTHGKTTTASLLAHILESAGLAPGYLIGGVPGNFSVSARLGKEPYFVVEADEYDTAFFDKRSKFVHYRPSTLILNNLEFDHADIFADLNAIETQFHHLMRCVPSAGRVVFNADSESISRVLARGCWSATTGFGRNGDWRLNDTLQLSGPSLSPTPPAGWVSDGVHNRLNALAAVAAAEHIGLPAAESLKSVASFKPPRRRLEWLGSPRGVALYDDFAHHPTAIAATLQALRDRHPESRLLVALELRSNSMRAGVHTAGLPEALQAAHFVVHYAPHDPPGSDALAGTDSKVKSVCDLVRTLSNEARESDCIVCMSNGSFDDAPRQILDALSAH